MTQRAASKLHVYLIAILGIVIWGGSPAATKLAVQSFDGFSVAILRTVFAAALVLPFALVKKLPLPITRSGWVTLGFASVIGNIAYVILFSIGIERTSTIHAALIIASAPIFTGLIGFSVEKKWPRPLWWVGAAVAF
ncbi:MAG: DMT family transporter, partial [Methylocystaceae bacterium]|nr:DMT family transporter [Methylocystaceae bacterium]